MERKAIINNKEFQKTDIKETWADISKAKRLLDWTPRISFEDGLSHTVAWYEENKPWLKGITI